MHSKLTHEARHNTEEGNILEIAGPNQVVKAVSAIGRERAGDFNGNFAFSRIKLRLESLGRFFGQLRGIGEIRGR